MTLIKIDRDMLIDGLYHLRSKVDISHDGSHELINVLMQIVELVQNAPLSESKSQFPRISARSN